MKATRVGGRVSKRTSCSPTRVLAEDLTGLTIERAARLIGTRKVSAVELTRATLERIAALDRLQAFITVTPELAMAQARRADRDLARGDHHGPLHGIPVSLKDLYWTKGIRTTGGSKTAAARAA